MFRHSLYAMLMLVFILFLSACDTQNGKTTDWFAPFKAEKRDTVTIVHNNDFHSQLEVLAPEGEPEQGGAAHLAALVKKIKAEKGADNVLLLFGGDMFQGSLFYNTWLGSAEVMVFNQMGYDAVALGNHEFDSGSEELGRALRGDPVTIAGQTYPTEKAEFLALATNIDYENEPALRDVLVKRAIVKKGGNSYGMLGITTTQTATGSSPGPNVHFLDYVPAVQEQVEALKAEGVDRIILMSHIGYPIDVVNAAQLSGVDVIVSGHDHALLGDEVTVAGIGLPKQVSRIRGPYPTLTKDKDGNTTVIVSAMEKGRWLGEIDVTFDEQGHVVADKLKPNLMFVRGCEVKDGVRDCSQEIIAPDAEMAAKVTEYGQPLEAFANQVMGEAAVTFGGRSAENPDAPPMGDLIAEILLDRGRSVDNAVVALVNRGGIRTDLIKGTVRYKDINAVMPFNNNLAMVDLSGDELVRVLDHGLTQAQGQSYGAFPHVAGMTVHYCAALPCPKALHKPDGVVTSVSIGGYPLQAQKTYRLATIDYLVGGGDLYAVLKEPCERVGNYCRKTSLVVKDVISDWFRTHSPVQPIAAERTVPVAP